MKFPFRHIISATVVLICLLPLHTFAEYPLNIHVGILPLKYFVERIGRDRVKVDVLLKPGKSPATYSPSPDQMKKLASSDIYFRVGLPFENNVLHKIEFTAGAKIVDIRQGIHLRKMEDSHNDGEEQGKESRELPPDSDGHDEHRFVGKDPHIWMNPSNVKTMASTILKAVSELDPDGLDAYKKNYKDFIKDLDELDSKLESILREFKGENLFVFHPSFGYFTDAYGLGQVAVETMGKSPKGKTLSKIIKLAKKENARVIFVQPQFDRSAAQKIASAINGAVISIDPLAYEYLANMGNIAQTITGALKE